MKGLKRKLALYTLLGAAAAVVLIFCVTRWGWRLFGFTFCNQAIAVESITVTENSVTIEGYDPQMFGGAYVGSCAEQDGDTLYLGIKLNTYLGVLPEDPMRFTCVIPTPQTVNRILLCHGHTSYEVWNRETNDEIRIRLTVDCLPGEITQMDIEVLWEDNPMLNHSLCWDEGDILLTVEGELFDDTRPENSWELRVRVMTPSGEIQTCSMPAELYWDTTRVVHLERNNGTFSLVDRGEE